MESTEVFMEATSPRVYKFGGTCIADEPGRQAAVGHCAKALSDGRGLVVVVSAMGRNGDPYATDTLSGLAPGAPAAERDSLLCCGEIISAAVMADALRSSGIPAESLAGWDAGLSTDGLHGDAEICRIDTARIRGLLERGVVPVVAGFQGGGPDGAACTLGRGGSDTTALALAAAIGAGEAVLFKNVDSIRSADPALVGNTIRMERISYEDLRQMSWQGAGVVHPRAAEIAGEAGIPVEVRRHSSGDTVTRIEPFVIRGGRYITGVASGPDVSRVSVTDPGGGPPSSFYANVFGAVADADISMDMFSVMGSIVLFTVDGPRAADVRSILSGMGFAVALEGPCSKVSIVGAGMHGMRGVMARFARTLDCAGIEMLQTVDSHATISALVRRADRDRALAALHHEFLEAG